MNARKLAASTLRFFADRVEPVEPSPLIEVHVKGDRGKLGLPTALHYIVCQRVGYLEWEPLYAEEKATGEPRDLPKDFKLRHDAIIALENAR